MIVIDRDANWRWKPYDWNPEQEGYMPIMDESEEGFMTRGEAEAYIVASGYADSPQDIESQIELARNMGWRRRRG